MFSPKQCSNIFIHVLSGDLTYILQNYHIFKVFRTKLTNTDRFLIQKDNITVSYPAGLLFACVSANTPKPLASSGI